MGMSYSIIIVDTHSGVQATTTGFGKAQVCPLPI